STRRPPNSDGLVISASSPGTRSPAMYSRTSASGSATRAAAIASFTPRAARSSSSPSTRQTAEDGCGGTAAIVPRPRPPETAVTLTMSRRARAPARGRRSPDGDRQPPAAVHGCQVAGLVRAEDPSPGAGEPVEYAQARVAVHV